MRFDMPPKWDGFPVEWSDWEDTPATLLCGPRGCVDGSIDTCQCCGFIGRFAFARGVVGPRSWHALSVSGGMIACLYASRCPRCGATYVLDGLGDDAVEWILDESDYTTQGSWEVRA